MIGFFEFNIAHCLHLALINYYISLSLRGKQNTAVKTIIDAYLIVSKIDIPDVVGQPASSLIINFEQVIDLCIFHFFLISG